MRTHIYSVRGKTTGPCLHCNACTKRAGECVQEDGFQEFRDLWVGAHVVLYAAPVYHVGVPGQLKCLIDRLGHSLRRRYAVSSPKRWKAVGALVQGAHLYGGQELTVNFILNHAVLMNCLPVSGDSWESYLGAAGWTGADAGRGALEELYRQGDRDAQAAVAAAGSVARRAVELALVIRAGVGASGDVLGDDPHYAELRRLWADARE